MARSDPWTQPDAEEVPSPAEVRYTGSVTAEPDDLGLHWMLDAFGCRAPTLDDPELVREILRALPPKLGLNAVGKPQVHLHEDASGELIIAGLVLISESHFGLHVRARAGVAHADIFSCRAFDPTRARAFLAERLRFERAEESLIRRGGGAP